MTLKGHLMLNSVFWSKVQVQDLLIYLYGQHRGESHMYACWKNVKNIKCSMS